MYCGVDTSILGDDNEGREALETVMKTAKKKSPSSAVPKWSAECDGYELDLGLLTCWAADDKCDPNWSVYDSCGCVLGEGHSRTLQEGKSRAVRCAHAYLTRALQNLYY